jgi:hypothetical protein
MGGYIRPVSGQRLGKHVPVATVTHAEGKRGIVYAVHAEEVKRSELVQSVQLTCTRWRSSSADSELTESFAREAVKIELERVKLKNFCC